MAINLPAPLGFLKKHNGEVALFLWRLGAEGGFFIFSLILCYRNMAGLQVSNAHKAGFPVPIQF